MSIAIPWTRSGAAIPDRRRTPDAIDQPAPVGLVARVRERARLSTTQDAEEITRAVVQCLLARLSRPLQLRLMHELPRWLASYLADHPVDGSPLEPPQAFFQQVAALAGLPPEAAQVQALAVGSVLAAELPDEVLGEIVAEVPRLFQSLAVGQIGPAGMPPPNRLGSDLVLPLYAAPTSTPSYLGLAWHCSSQKL